MQLNTIKADLNECNATNNNNMKTIKNLIYSSNVARNLMMDLLDLAQLENN